MAKVVLNNVFKSFEQTHVIQDACLTVEDRQFVVIVGPSGCGKSTLLRMIAGLENLTQGQILIDDKVMNDVPPKDRDIAMVFQNYALYPHMSVYDNMAFGLKMRRVPKQEIRKKVQEASVILDLQALLDRKPKQLSGGQRQRVALGRAIVRNPKVFLMDEPLSNLDAKLRVQMRGELTRLHQCLNATTIYVTHDQVEAMTMGDRIVILNRGQIQQMDTPLKVYHEPANCFVAGFVGQMNFLKGSLQKEGFLLEDGALLPFSNRLSHAYEGQKAIMGLRPEHIRWESHPDGGYLTEAIPERLELLGSEQMIFFSFQGGNTLAVRWPSDMPVNATGQTQSIRIDMSKALFFDADTEQRLV